MHRSFADTPTSMRCRKDDTIGHIVRGRAPCGRAPCGRVAVWPCGRDGITTAPKHSSSQPTRPRGWSRCASGSARRRARHRVDRRDCIPRRAPAHGLRRMDVVNQVRAHHRHTSTPAAGTYSSRGRAQVTYPTGRCVPPGARRPSALPWSGTKRTDGPLREIRHQATFLGDRLCPCVGPRHGEKAGDTMLLDQIRASRRSVVGGT